VDHQPCLCFGRGIQEVVIAVIGQDKQVIAAWQEICPVGLFWLILWGQSFTSFLGNMLLVSPILLVSQDGFRREWPRVKDTDTKWRQGCQAFFLLLVNLWAQDKS
jgi:hypothetical protein